MGVQVSHESDNPGAKRDWRPVAGVKGWEDGLDDAEPDRFAELPRHENACIWCPQSSKNAEESLQACYRRTRSRAGERRVVELGKPRRWTEKHVAAQQSRSSIEQALSSRASHVE